MNTQAPEQTGNEQASTDPRDKAGDYDCSAPFPRELQQDELMVGIHAILVEHANGIRTKAMTRLLLSHEPEDPALAIGISHEMSICWLEIYHLARWHSYDKHSAAQPWDRFLESYTFDTNFFEAIETKISSFSFCPDERRSLFATVARYCIHKMIDDCLPKTDYLTALMNDPDLRPVHDRAVAAYDEARNKVIQPASA